MNDVLIETFPSTANLSIFPGYRMTRVPLGGTRYQLKIEGECANLFGCPGHPTKELSALASFIETGQE